MTAVWPDIRRRTAGAVLAALVLVVGGSASTPARSGTATVGLFGYLEFPSPDLAALPVWLDVFSRLETDRERARACDEDEAACDGAIVTVWRAKVQELANLDVESQLQEVNRYVNGLAEPGPSPTKGGPERWAAPFEFLEKGGAAADFAVMKFATLRDLGMANEAMRIAVVYDALRNRRHAVLVVRHASGFRVLDTWSDAVLDASRVKYYVPFYSVNETTRWAHVVNRPLGKAGRADDEAK